MCAIAITIALSAITVASAHENTQASTTKNKNTDPGTNYILSQYANSFYRVQQYANADSKTIGALSNMLIVTIADAGDKMEEPAVEGSNVTQRAGVETDDLDNLVSDLLARKDTAK